MNMNTISKFDKNQATMLMNPACPPLQSPISFPNTFVTPKTWLFEKLRPIHLNQFALKTGSLWLRPYDECTVG
jgi:hypothetical protein